jgi:type I restriction enzyme S subunit
MNAERLLMHYERVADAPDAIPRLRCFILDLAVRGKLVPQHSKDEPASELLKRIASEKARCGIRHDVLPRGSEEAPFELPPGWSWTRIGEVCSKTGSGSTPRGGQAVYKNTGVPFLRSQNVYDEGLRLDDVAYIDTATHERMAGTAVKEKDLLLNITGGSMGRCCRVPDGFGKANVSQHVAIIRTTLPGTEDFLHRLVLSPYFQAFIFDEQTGAGRGGLPKNRMDRIAVAFPPLAEQQRIVTKVDELMALCDRLEAARARREATRDRLVAASLARLNAPTPEIFRDDARFALNALPALTTRPDQIKQLRQTIFSLAVRGKLVPQDPKDEPAPELVKRIAMEISAVSAGGPNYEFCPFDAPPGWTWICLGRLVGRSDAGWSPKTEDRPRAGEEWGVLKVSAVSWDKFRAWENKQILPGTQPRLQAQVKRGDFLISRANTVELIARAVIVDEEPVNLMMSDKIVRLRLSANCDHRYVWIVNNYADFARGHYARHASGVSASMKNVSRDVIMTLPLPLPPLAEQHRIVTRVDELMALCDQLEASLTYTAATCRRLLDTLLHQGVSTIGQALPLARQEAA